MGLWEQIIWGEGAGGELVQCAGAAARLRSPATRPAQLSRTSPDITRPPHLGDRLLLALGIVEDKQ